MATPPVSTSKIAGSKIDVASIVNQLMEVERRPLVRLESKLNASSVKISSLGQFQAKLGAVRDALKDLQTSSNFTAVSPSYSRTGVFTASVESAATAGVHTISVTTLAKPLIRKVEGFDSESEAMAWFNDDSRVTLRSAADGAVIQKPDGKYMLWLTAKAGAFTVSLNADDVTAGLTTPADPVQAAVNATFEVNGNSYTRATNVISDVIAGVTLNLNEVSPAGDAVTLTLAASAGTAQPKIQAFVTAYNDFHSLYKSETQSSIDPESRGVFNGDATLSSIMRELSDAMIRPLVNSSGVQLPGQKDLSLLGLTLTDKGVLVLDTSLLSRSSDLQLKLASGLRVGYDSSTSKDLSQKISDMLAIGGLIAERVDQERDAQVDLSKRKSALEAKMTTIQSRLTAQFAALDALLFKLNNTSAALTSAFDALTASQKKD